MHLVLSNRRSSVGRAFEGPHQQLSFIRDDAVNSPIGKPEHRVAIIHRPSQDLLARAVNLLYQFPRDQRMVRHHVFDVEFAKTRKRSRLVTDNAGSDTRAPDLQRGHDSRQERRNHVIVFQPVIAQCSEHLRFESRNLKFNIKKGAGSVAAENFLQAWQLKQLIGGGLRNGNVIDLGVMTNHRAPAASQTHVELKTSAAVIERQIERRKSILRDSGKRTRATMTEKQGRSAHEFILCRLVMQKGL
jgi:hypothetical protein